MNDCSRKRGRRLLFLSLRTSPLAIQIDSELTEYFFLKGTSNVNSIQEVIVPGVDDNSWEVEPKFLVENQDYSIYIHFLSTSL